MIEMLGQKAIQQKIANLVQSGRFPKTSIIVGGKGFGKRHLVKEIIAPQLGADVYEPEDLKVDSIRGVIENASALSTPRIYLLAGVQDMTLQAQNALLKLSEEPTPNAYIVMTTYNVEQMLPTILSRSILLQMDPYAPAELSRVTRDEKLTRIAESPGQVYAFRRFDYMALIETAEKVANNIGSISAANVFNILRHVTKEHYDYFITVLLYVYGEKLKEGAPVQQEIRIIYETKQLLARSKGINSQNALEVMFIQMRGAAMNAV